MLPAVSPAALDDDSEPPTVHTFERKLEGVGSMPL